MTGMETGKKPIYPVQPWDITETEFSMETSYRNETTFSLSNGYIGTRGTFEESYGFSVDEGLEGNFINGFYESEDIRYGEWNFGFPEKSQSLLNLPNGKGVQIYLDEELFDMREGQVEEYRRVLHMKEGLLERSLLWISPGGRKARFSFERLVSFSHKNVMAQRVRICALEGISQVRLVSFLDADVENHTRKTNPLVDYGPFGRRIISRMCTGESGRLYFQGETLKSGLQMACGVVHQARGWKTEPEGQQGRRQEKPEAQQSRRQEKPEAQQGCGQEKPEAQQSRRAGSTQEDPQSARLSGYFARAVYTAAPQPGEELLLDKFIIYTSSLDMEAETLSGFVKEQGELCLSLGYEQLRREQKAYMESFWHYSDVEISGDERLQQGIRFNLFHVMQSAGRDGRTGMGAKGVSGEGYEGHYFWDTEMYVLPFFIYTAPKLAKQLLAFRYHTLGQARDRARVLGHPKGALFPWRTINGEEASTYFPLGTAQYHINADIAYAFSLYVRVTGDEEFFREMAAEVLCETARVWADVGCFAKCRGDRYCICAVTGPDEYNAIVDNNFYTNLMARENIRDALMALEHLQEMDEEGYQEFIRRMQITSEETQYWQRIVDNMYFPYDEERGVYPLDDGFLMRKPWDDSRIPPEKRHLLYENYHPLFVYRQRMSKQADAILGMYLHSPLFTEEELKRNYDFYQEVTLHHSSLSTCIFGIVACEIGYYDEAYQYFMQSARMDLDDYHDNFYAGIHAANMAGTWQAIVNGFGGLRFYGGRLSLKPYLPPQWEGLSFTLRSGGSAVKIVMTKGNLELRLLEGPGLSVWLGEKEIILSEKENSFREKI